MEWYKSKKKLRQSLSELTARYMTVSANASAKIEELEGKVETAREARKAYIKDLKAQVSKARDETEFVIGAFSSEIHKIKTELHRLRLDGDIAYVESELVKSQARAMYLFGQSEKIPWEELEKQASLIARLMALRQEHQQT